MNARIKLPAQEWLGYDPEKGDLHGYTVEQMREFAELIVRQCAYIAWRDACQDPSECILEHFGIVKQHAAAEWPKEL